MKSFSFVCQKYLYFTSIFKGYFKILILLFLIRKQISFLLLFSCIKCCLFLWLLSRFSIYLGLQTLTMISLRVLCVFLLYEVCWASWIYGLVSLIDLGSLSGMALVSVQVPVSCHCYIRPMSDCSFRLEVALFLSSPITSSPQSFKALLGS